MMKYLFLLILLVSGVCYGQDRNNVYFFNTTSETCVKDAKVTTNRVWGGKYNITINSVDVDIRLKSFNVVNANTGITSYHIKENEWGIDAVIFSGNTVYVFYKD